MRKLINNRTYNTETAKLLGVKYAGEFGNADGYEEQLFMTKNKEYFIYGVGGAESKYVKRTLTLITEKEADAWKKENIK